jgi:hypothetical protein
MSQATTRLRDQHGNVIAILGGGLTATFPSTTPDLEPWVPDLDVTKDYGDAPFSDGSQQILGRFNATQAGHGIALTPTRTWFMRGNADDGGQVLSGAGAAYLFSSRRLLLTRAQTGNNSFFGGGDRLSVAADESAVTAEMAANWSMLEVKSGGVIGNAAGVGAVRGDININSGGDIASGTFASCFLAACESVGATHTGKAVVLHVKKPQTGTFDGFMELQSTSGVIDAHTAGSSASNKQILITIDGSPFALAVCAVGA